MYERIGAWLKDWWGAVVAVLTAVIGFLVGRQFPRRTDVDIEGLRQRIDELREQLARREKRLAELGQLHEDTRQRLALAEAELAEARAVVDRAKASGDGIDGDLESLRDVRDRLADLAERYGTKDGKSAELE